MKTPLYKVHTNDCYPYNWQWDGNHFANQEAAEAHASKLHADHWQVQILGRAPSGKWVTIGGIHYNGNAGVTL